MTGQTSPGDKIELLNGKEDGTFEGGRTAIITGTLLANPAWRLRGNVGTVDNGCDIFQNCPGYVSWVGQYFAFGSVYADTWWGWIYHGTHNAWVNSIDGDVGDVL